MPPTFLRCVERPALATGGGDAQLSGANGSRRGGSLVVGAAASKLPQRAARRDVMWTYT